MVIFKRKRFYKKKIFISIMLKKKVNTIYKHKRIIFFSFYNVIISYEFINFTFNLSKNYINNTLKTK